MIQIVETEGRTIVAHVNAPEDGATPSWIKCPENLEVTAARSVDGSILVFVRHVLTDGDDEAPKAPSRAGGAA